MRNFLLKPETTIAAAMQRVSKNGEGFAAVVDDDRKLLGTFCDADGRLAMLRGVSFDQSVTEVMAKPRSRLQRMPGGFELTKGVVTKVITHERPPVEAVVMAGGKGTRLRAVTGTVPKPLLSLGRSTIVERIIGRLGDAGVSDVWVSVNYRARDFKRRLGSAVRYIDESTPLGTAGALSLLPNSGPKHIFVTNADLITSVDYARMFDFHRAHGGPITMAAALVSTPIKFGVVHATGDGVLEEMEEKPNLELLCNAGMYVLDRSTLKLVPKNEFFLMTDLIDAVKARGEEVHVFPMHEKWVDAGSPEEFQQVLIEFATGAVQ